MKARHDFDVFARIFRENLIKRSRTAKGISETSISSSKKPLLKSDEELKKQVERNTQKLIRFVWENGTVYEIKYAVRTHFVRWFCEKCDSFINFGLANPLRYKEEISLLRKNSLALSRLTGIFYTINPAYRIWNVSYAGIEIPLCELEFAMNKFYMGIAALIDHHQRNFPQSEILAFADHMMDGVIHPWADGCGRNATALVMWLSLLPGFQLPIFGTREEHYASILNLNLHTEYFRQCLDKQS